MRGRKAARRVGRFKTAIGVGLLRTIPPWCAGGEASSTDVVRFLSVRIRTIVSRAARHRHPRLMAHRSPLGNEGTSNSKTATTAPLATAGGALAV